MSVTRGPVALTVVFSLLSSVLATRCDTSCVNGKCAVDLADKKLTLRCRCDALWFGKSCSEFICDRQETNPCRNGARCQPTSNYTDYQCLCTDSYSGKHCEVSNNCTRTSCMMYGKCSEDTKRPHSYKCRCDAGFTGVDCDTNIDDCDGVDCHNGTCVDGINGYICKCNINYTGTHCNQLDYCAIHSADRSHGCVHGVCCDNGGTCINDFINRGHRCNCKGSWLSTFGCRRVFKPCYLSPCQNNGNCTRDSTYIGYVCHCNANFTGERCEVSTQLAVTVHPQGIVIPLGRNVTLTCKADISGKLVYAWERKHSQKWTIISNYNSATYTTSIFGQYRCKVSDKKITAVSGVAIVKVQQGPLKLILTTQPKNSFKKTGDFHTLTCNASGPGTLTYSWERKADLKWTIVSRHEPSYNTSMEGHYRCRVANEAGSVVSKKAFIKYYKSPKISLHPENRLVGFNRSTILKCKASGRKPFSYHWEIRHVNKGPWMVIRNSFNGRLVLKAVQSTSHVRCVASNLGGVVISEAATITVLKITSHPRNKHVLTGSTVSLTCSASPTNVEFLWRHRGKKLHYNNKRRASKSSGGTSTLIIMMVRIRDGGEYVCEARSGSSSVTSTVANLTVSKNKP